MELGTSHALMIGVAVAVGGNVAIAYGIGAVARAGAIVGAMGTRL